MSEKNKKNLVMGVIRNYEFDQIEPFLVTLKKTGYTGDVVFLYANIKEKTLAELRKYGVILIPFEDAFPFLPAKYRDETPDIKDGLNFKLHIFCLRHILYYLYLKKEISRYDKAMITDVRDVIFQKDPFAFDDHGRLTCSLEEDGFIIGNCRANSGWIRDAYGEAALKELGNEAISCAGVTIGPADKVLSYLEAMKDQVVGLRSSGNIDQGIHNYIIRKGLVKDVELYRNNEGPVLTLASTKKVAADKDGNFINTKGSIPNIVHQYDRHHAIAKQHYSKKLKRRIFIANTRQKINRKVLHPTKTFIKTRFPSLHQKLKKGH